MKINQNFLFGLGTGFILASMIFGVADLVGSSPLSPQSSMVPLPTSGLNSVQPAQSQPLQSAENKQSGQQQQTQSAVGTQVPQNKQPQRQPENKTVSVTIKVGMQAAEIAELLKEKGVIADVNAFLNNAKDRTTNIRIGTYELPINGDNDAVLKIITNDNRQ